MENLVSAMKKNERECDQIKEQISIKDKQIKRVRFALEDEPPERESPKKTLAPI